MYLLLSRTQAGPGRAVKQEQEEISHNHVPSLFAISVHVMSHGVAGESCSIIRHELELQTKKRYKQTDSQPPRDALSLPKVEQQGAATISVLHNGSGGKEGRKETLTQPKTQPFVRSFADILALGGQSKILGSCWDALKVVTCLQSSLWASPHRLTQCSKTSLKMSDWKCEILTEPSNGQESYSPPLEQGYLFVRHLAITNSRYSEDEPRMLSPFAR